MFPLNTGARIPACGLGTWRASPGEVYAALRTAISIGYRHIDCAYIYENQCEIGKAIADVIRDNIVRREDLFITSKLWCEHTDPAVVPLQLDETLRDLQLEYVDLYLVHWPLNLRNGVPMRSSEPQPTIVETWKAMCALSKSKVRSVGVSNFSITHLEAIIKETGQVPAVNQIEIHPYNRQDALIDYCTSKSIHVSAYCPLGRGGSLHGKASLPSLITHETVVRIAEKYERTPAQIILAWSVLRGCSVLPKSVSEHRLRENFACTDLKISEEDMEVLNSIEPQTRIIQPTQFTRPDGWYPTVDDIWR